MNQPHRLIQIGIALFLAAILLGLVVPYLAVPRLGLSAHLVGMLQGMFLALMGLVWPRLALSSTQSRVAFVLLIYQAFAAPASNLLGAVWGAGNSIVPMAAGAAHGTAVQEAVVSAGLRSAGAALIVALVLVLWGLRQPAK
jgi:hydroxylaminobenzene mutase